jgi:hypothetical protein
MIYRIKIACQQNIHRNFFYLDQNQRNILLLLLKNYLSGTTSSRDFHHNNLLPNFVRVNCNLIFILDYLRLRTNQNFRQSNS